MTLLDTAQLLGNIGEFAGAIAVVATLGYLAVQVRQSKRAVDNNTRETRAASTQAALDSEMTFQSQILRYADVWEKVVTAAPIAPGEESRRAIVLYQMLMTQYENQYHQYQSGYLEHLPDYERVVDFPTFEMWRASLGTAGRSPEFLAFIDGVKARAVGTMA